MFLNFELDVVMLCVNILIKYISRLKSSDVIGCSYLVRHLLETNGDSSLHIIEHTNYLIE